MKEAFPGIEVREALDLPDYPEEIEGKGSRAPESGSGTYSAA